MKKNNAVSKNLTLYWIRATVSFESFRVTLFLAWQHHSILFLPILQRYPKHNFDKISAIEPSFITKLPGFNRAITGLQPGYNRVYCKIISKKKINSRFALK